MTPFWILVAIVIGGGLLIAWIADSVDGVEEDKRAALNVQAADFGEPSRAQVEWDARVAEAIAVTEEPIFHATVAHIAAQEAAGLDDEWRRIADGRWSM